MVLKVQLALPHGKPSVVLHPLLELVEEYPCKLLAHHGNALHTLLHTDGSLQHFPGRAAASVPVAVGDQNVIVDILVLVAHPASNNGVRVQHAIVGGEEIGHRLSHAQGGDQVGEDFRSVDTPPHHSVIGYLVELIPGQLCGHKIVNAALLHNLGKSACVSKHVGQPQNAVVHAEFFFEEPFSVHKLPYQRLA